MADPQVLEYINGLSAPERLALIGELWDSLETDVPLTTAHREELNQRLETLAEDRAEATSWTALRSELELDHP